MRKSLILILFFFINILYGQEASNYKEEDVLSKCFTDLIPIQPPNYPAFQTELCSILKCFTMLSIISYADNTIDLSGYEKQILQRIDEISILLYVEGKRIYITNGLDCKDRIENEITYICVADCQMPPGYHIGAKVFNNRTMQLINNNKKKTK